MSPTCLQSGLVSRYLPAVRYWGYPPKTYSDGTVRNRKAWPLQFSTNVSTGPEVEFRDDLEMFDRLGMTTLRRAQTQEVKSKA